MALNIAIVDYGAGNLRSAEKAFARVVAQEGMDASVSITSHADDVAKATHIVLPGQGAFGDCQAGLNAVDGMVEALTETVLRGGRPFLGICVGMQLLADYGLEHGETAGLGWIPGTVDAIEPSDPALKIPHMGWNNLTFHDAPADGPLAGDHHPVLTGLKDGDHAYFVHSYAFRCAEPADLLANCDYGGPVTAIIGRDNLVGTQFHPEKSQRAGLTIIANFLRWRP